MQIRLSEPINMEIRLIELNNRHFESAPFLKMKLNNLR